jgi:hypothetical protein
MPTKSKSILYLIVMQEFKLNLLQKVLSLMVRYRMLFSKYLVKIYKIRHKTFGFYAYSKIQKTILIALYQN